MKRRILGLLATACAALVLTADTGVGQTRDTEHTLKLDDPSAPGTANFADLAWLVGSWEGAAFGGRIEETWTPPSGGTMMGVFKHLADDEVTFYEFLLFEQEGETISLKLKHFTPELVGWEQPEDFVTFRLVRVESDALFFQGLTFRKTGPDSLEIYLALSQDGVRTEEHMEMTAR